MEIGLKSDNKAVIQIHASGDKTEFIKVKVKRILNPGMENESLQDYDPSLESDVIVSPQKLVVTPGSTRLVRILTMNKPQKETAWRIYMEGVSPENINVDTGNSKASAQLSSM